MAKLPGVLTGTAGAYYVASQLAARGFHAAITHGNAPSVDILVGSLDGTSTVSLQVKTSSQALVTKGRGLKKEPDYYQWRMSEHSARLNHPNLFFALVNLKLGRFVDVEPATQTLPDVFIVPSKVVYDVYAQHVADGHKYVGWWWRGTQRLEQYKNNWKRLDDHLAGKVSQ